MRQGSCPTYRRRCKTKSPLSSSPPASWEAVVSGAAAAGGGVSRVPRQKQGEGETTVWKRPIEALSWRPKFPIPQPLTANPGFASSLAPGALQL